MSMYRRESRKKVDRFTKKRATKAQAPRGVRGHAPPSKFFDSNFLNSRHSDVIFDSSILLG